MWSLGRRSTAPTTIGEISRTFYLFPNLPVTQLVHALSGQNAVSMQSACMTHHEDAFRSFFSFFFFSFFPPVIFSFFQEKRPRGRKAEAGGLRGPLGLRGSDLPEGLPVSDKGLCQQQQQQARRTQQRVGAREKRVSDGQQLGVGVILRGNSKFERRSQLSAF